MRRLPFLAIVIASLGGICAPRFTPPKPDACDHPSSAAIDTVELGTGDDQQFTPLHDGDVLQTIHGPQGGTMFPVRLRLTGAATPDCMTQSTSLDGPDPIAHDATPLKTYAQPDGTRLTMPDYLVFFGYAQPGDTVTMSVEAGGQTLAARLFY